ncbi:MAG: Crp/Fnr family transcriptional regulator [Acidobacteria bacterium]|nr:Crp/Fnr family transcriptional regulator [Acidobacteriota bacterium]
MRSLENIGSEKLVKRILDVGRLRTFQTGERIFSEGDPAEFLPIVLNGKIKVVRFLDQGKEVIINIFQNGEIFAIPPVIDGKRYPATAIAMDVSKMLLIYRQDFLMLTERSEEFSSMTVERMCLLLRETTSSITNLLTASSERRVGNVIVRLAKKDGGNGPIKIALRRQDIADMAGLTTETTIRAIRRLADKTAITILRGKIIVEDLKNLEAFLSA